MNKTEKQRNEAKKLLKQKLVNYQNELKNQSDIVIYDGYLTSKSQQRGPFNFIQSSIELNFRKSKGEEEQYEHYLNYPCNQQDFTQPMKSLTRQNIQAINKKAKIIRINLNEIAKKKRSLQTHCKPLNSKQNSRSVSPQNPQKSLQLNMKLETQKSLWNLLTIKQSKKQDIQRPYDYIRKSLSQQGTRKKIYSSIQVPQSIKTRARSVLSSKKISNFEQNNQKDVKLTEFYTPNYHKQTNSGYIINQFKPRIKAKHFQDNLKVMATLIKKKVYKLQGEGILDYMRKIGQKKNYYTPTNQIHEIVRKKNQLNAKNIYESKLMKTRRKTKPQTAQSKSRNKQLI